MKATHVKNATSSSSPSTTKKAGKKAPKGLEHAIKGAEKTSKNPTATKPEVKVTKTAGAEVETEKPKVKASKTHTPKDVKSPKAKAKQAKGDHSEPLEPLTADEVETATTGGIKKSKKHKKVTHPQHKAAEKKHVKPEEVPVSTKSKRVKKSKGVSHTEAPPATAPKFHGVKIAVTDDLLAKIAASAVRHGKRVLSEMKVKKTTNVRQVFKDAAVTHSEEQLANFLYKEFVAQCKAHGKNPHFYAEALKDTDLSKFEL